MPDKISIALGVTGSIAAYKAADLCSRLAQAGFDVNVIMTESATKLVTPQTFRTLSRNPVMTDLWDISDWRPGHIDLSQRATLLIVAPCTANFIGKMASGIADDALTTYALSHTGKILIAPAMNPQMWANSIVQENCERLRKHKIEFIGPDSGSVACGDDGPGRMTDPDNIFEKIKSLI